MMMIMLMMLTVLFDRFSDAMGFGLLEVIAPSPNFYANMNDLKDKFGDTMERVKSVILLLCMPVSFSVYLSLSLCTCLFLCMPVSFSVYLSFSLYVCLFLCMSVSLCLP